MSILGMFLAACVCSLVFILMSNRFYDWQTIDLDYELIDAPIRSVSTKGIGNYRTVDETSSSISSSTKKFRLFQVINTFAINKDDANDPIHQPYDQWSTLQSIDRAKKHVPQELNVTLVCAMFQSDWRVLSKENAPACDRRFLLERSTITEYGNQNYNGTNANRNANKNQKEALVSELFSKRELPFLQDLLDAAVVTALESEPSRETEERGTNRNDDDFYVMLANSDIGLTKDFYSFLLPELKKGRKAFTINRWSIPMDRRPFNTGKGKGKDKDKPHTITIREPTTNPTEIAKLLAQIDASLPTGKSHPGYDCFVIHSSVIEKVRLGNLFAGFPPWGSALQIILKDIIAPSDGDGDSDSDGFDASRSYARINSSPNATFHLGDKGTWSKKKVDKGVGVAMAHLRETHQKDILDCPKRVFSDDPHTLVNTANCGRVFGEFYHLGRGGGPIQ